MPLAAARALTECAVLCRKELCDPNESTDAANSGCIRTEQADNDRCKDAYVRSLC